MKGPGMRLALDVRRVWECPECGHRRKTDGHVVAKRCNCQKEGVSMRLIEERGPMKSSAAPVGDDAEPDAASLETTENE